MVSRKQGWSVRIWGEILLEERGPGLRLPGSRSGPSAARISPYDLPPFAHLPSHHDIKIRRRPGEEENAKGSWECFPVTLNLATRTSPRVQRFIGRAREQPLYATKKKEGDNSFHIS